MNRVYHIQITTKALEKHFSPAALQKIVEASPVGNYALSFTFGDLHRTGIYQWPYLRELSTAPAPAPH